MNKVIITSKLEALLQSKWTQFIDKPQLMRTILEDTRDEEYKILYNKELPDRQLKISVSFHSASGNTTDPYIFEVWAEFTVPKDNGVVIGTHVYSVNSKGELKIKETYGSHFLPELKNV